MYDYVRYVARVNENKKLGMQVKEAVNRAVEWAIKEDLLDVFLPAKNASLREQVKTLRASDSLRQEVDFGKLFDGI